MATRSTLLGLLFNSFVVCFGRDEAALLQTLTDARQHASLQALTQGQERSFPSSFPGLTVGTVTIPPLSINQMFEFLPLLPSVMQSSMREKGKILKSVKTFRYNARQATKSLNAALSNVFDEAEVRQNLWNTMVEYNAAWDTFQVNISDMADRMWGPIEESEQFKSSTLPKELVNASKDMMAASFTDSSITEMLNLDVNSSSVRQLIIAADDAYSRTSEKFHNVTAMMSANDTMLLQSLAMVPPMFTGMMNITQVYLDMKAGVNETMEALIITNDVMHNGIKSGIRAMKK